MTLVVQSILNELDLKDITDVKEIALGADSKVLKVQTKDGQCYAVRLLPVERHAQFLREGRIIDYVRSQGVQVPNVHAVLQSGEWAVMLMDWATGVTILDFLTTSPHQAFHIGMEFGRVHAAIHNIPGPEWMLTENWNFILPESNDELRIWTHIKRKASPLQHRMLHMDYHPLNVLTDGKTITAVIDWANASIGDPRFDYSRTKSILKLEGKQLENLLPNSEEVLFEFEKGWETGYLDATQSNPNEHLFHAWAGYRMIRDLKGRRSESEYERIRNWAQSWEKTLTQDS